MFRFHLKEKLDDNKQTSKIAGGSSLEFRIQISE